MNRVYLDNASTTPIRLEVLKVMTDTLKYSFGNPSSLHHSYGREARSIIEESRICIANKIQSFPNEIIFTSGGTESNELVFKLSVLKLGVKHILTTKLEHVSVLRPLLFLSKKNNVSLSFIHFNENGTIDLNHIEEILKKFSFKKKLVSLMYANNEIGNLLLNIQEIIFLCKKYNSYFHSDAIQSIGNYPINTKKLQIDFITASAHKFYGPKGVGFVFIRNKIMKKVNLNDHKMISNQEYGIRPGTENISGIVGLSKALELSFDESFSYINKIKKLKYYCIIKLREIIPNIIFNGLSFDLKKSTPSILNFLYPIKKIDHLFYFHLDLMGISVSKGSSCDNDSKTSHVIQCIVNKSLLKKTMPIRVSFGKFNKKKDIDLLIDSLKRMKKII